MIRFFRFDCNVTLLYRNFMDLNVPGVFQSCFYLKSMLIFLRCKVCIIVCIIIGL